MTKRGFKNPPIEHRWKKGQSGNPSGRTRKKTTFKQDIAGVLFEPIYIQDANGRKKRTHLYDVALINFCKKILAGSPAEFCKGFRAIETILTQGEEEQVAANALDPKIEKALKQMGFQIQGDRIVRDESSLE